MSLKGKMSHNYRPANSYTKLLRKFGGNPSGAMSFVNREEKENPQNIVLESPDEDDDVIIEEIVDEDITDSKIQDNRVIQGSTESDDGTVSSPDNAKVPVSPRSEKKKNRPSSAKRRRTRKKHSRQNSLQENINEDDAGEENIFDDQISSKSNTITDECLTKDNLMTIMQTTLDKSLGKLKICGDESEKLDEIDIHQGTRKLKKSHPSGTRDNESKRTQKKHTRVKEKGTKVNLRATENVKEDGKKTPVKKNRRSKTKQLFESYWSEKDVMDGLKRELIIQGTIRINPKHYQDAYVPNPNGESDIFISGLKDRNRTLNGDIVAVVINPKEDWRILDIDSIQPHGISELNITGAINTDLKDKTVKTELAEEHVPNRKGHHHSYNVTLKEHLKSTVKGQCAIEDDGSEYRSLVEKFPEPMLQKTARVVYIVERKHSRACTGYIKPLADNNPNRVLFSPIDCRLPRITVPISDCPKGFLERPGDYSTTLFIARITEWRERSAFAEGTLARSLGEAGEIEPETEGILIENGVDYAEFPQEAIGCLPETPWKIPESEYERRKEFDFRKTCLFTIDPATARDLDDAVHCNDLGGGVYEVGVHIADVSYFLQEKTDLDHVAGERATSVYLVQKVVPMLPRLLCEQLCSLNPDEDRLSFSVVWHINEEGDVLDEKFGKSIIRSCVKLSYNHAQGFIDEPSKDWTRQELPPISEGFSVEDIKLRVLTLNKIAKYLRKKRFDTGALRLDQVKLQYTLDSETGLPNGYFVYEQRDSNKLIEEFMLLANMAVAHKIFKEFPEVALLRRHPPPQPKMIDELVELCKNIEIPIDATNSGSLQQSLAALSSNDPLSKAKIQVTTALCSKPMQTARYFCTGCLEDESQYRHYALSVPLYTHFTSPIRRYADVMVHRLLAAALGYCDPPAITKNEVQVQANHCNDKKSASKIVQELSSDMFFAIFVKECGPLEEEGMVMSVMDHSFDVLILKLGVVKRVYIDKLNLTATSFRKDHKRPELTLTWAADDIHSVEVQQVITIFTRVIAVLKADERPLKWNAVIKHPEDNTYV